MSSAKKQKIILNICIIIYIATSLLGFYQNIKNNDMRSIQMGLVALITPCLIPIVFRIFKFKITYEVCIVNIIFVYFASLIGSCFGGYSLPYFDKILHFFSGIFASLLAIILYDKITNKVDANKDNLTLKILFISHTNLAIAVIWEFYEYLLLVLFNNDSIHHYSSGVHDTLTDMICAFIGGMIVIIMFILNKKFNKKSYLIDMCDDIAN